MYACIVLKDQMFLTVCTLPKPEGFQVYEIYGSVIFYGYIAKTSSFLWWQKSKLFTTFIASKNRFYKDFLSLD
jgi:hypothetical protein